ncbi:MAG: phosphoglucosamine mutase [Ignavibacteria bacterium]|nr:phosphoglucosamine mutase [Ignavibacteria bacterium]
MNKNINELIVSVSGIRGIIGETLTPKEIVKYVSAFGEFIRKKYKNKNIILGRDGRKNGELIYSLSISTLAMLGFKVHFVGVAPTPTIQIATSEIDSAGGISVTASHNPQEWNGLKFLKPDGTFIEPNDAEKIKYLASKNNFKYANTNVILPPIPSYNWIYRHIEKALSLKYINPKLIKRKNFKVVVDAVNSSGSIIVPMLLQKLGCKVIQLHCDCSGIFPHNPEPLPNNLKSLSKAVTSNKADLGIAVDPDADRLVLIMENGKPFGEENTIVSVVNFILRKSGKGNVTVNLSTTRAVDDIAKIYNAKVFRTPVGEINVVKEMKKNNSICGGEGSGGVIIPDSLGGHYGRDSIFGIVIILQELAETNKTISEYKNLLPAYKIEKSKIENVKNPDLYINKIIESAKKQNCKVTITDGVKLDFPDYWIHYRKSNTEPIIRIIKETKLK